MRQIKNIIIVVLLVIIVSCLDPGNLTLTKVNNFPQWIKNNNSFPDQTSGIAFLGTDKSNRKIFLIADDIGKLHYLKYNEDKLTSIEDVTLSDKAIEYLKDFPKKDFEDVLYDKNSGKIFVSIEGNGQDFRKFVGIYEFVFTGGDVYSGEVKEIKKIKIEPEAEFYKYTNMNIGFEGIASDDDYFYFGIESTILNPILSDSTLIYIVDKKDNEIKKVISTKQMGIISICGLYCYKNKVLLGVDRNRKALFKLIFDQKLNVLSYDRAEIKTNIPGYSEYDYLASLESVTMEGDYIYFVDDPWRTHFVPTEEILLKTNNETRENFNKFIPIIFKFKLEI